jgi:hypothetical protein
MMDGKFEVVCVTTPPPEKLMEFMGQPMSAKVVYQFSGAVTGKDLQFILDIKTENLMDIFITAAGLLGNENIAREAMIKVGLMTLEKAKTYGP